MHPRKLHFLKKLKHDNIQILCVPRIKILDLNVIFLSCSETKIRSDMDMHTL